MEVKDKLSNSAASNKKVAFQNECKIFLVTLKLQEKTSLKYALVRNASLLSPVYQSGSISCCSGDAENSGYVEFMSSVIEQHRSVCNV